ncbi:ATP-binding protein [Kineosporia succinea]|uniref:DNA-binding CsgD family transcriptional regulator/tetratricopeptide (TPR) repeat protein n=1 Tax=Kineosporia succinea TaxID=84632 RepID=A0ABT9PDS3_9ACTN|nr:helix-turn-helix transcriptional regulator [Kineosporia succinea]MDP9830135.1 DNA-binding CsgD family transcriptional regulator/tetratricopeptide (TPR) repeat protein [Kineosporia succinea]
MAGSVVASPVMVGRDEFLTLGGRRLAEAGQGRGELLFVTGEAGIGKTRLLGALTRQARTQGFAVTRAAAFPADTESSAGLLLDLAGEVGDRSLGRRLTERIRALAAAPATGGDAHHHRRLLVADLTALLLEPRPDGPHLIVLDDLHWADAVSLDVLGRLAPRLSTRPLLIAAAYRSDELPSRRSLRELRARLLAQRQAEEIRLPRLDRSQVGTLTGAVLGGPVPALLVEALHRRSDGIPLHVEELLAAGSSADRIDRVPVPDTLGEAVLSRVRQLSAATRHVARAASVIGRSFGFDLLVVVTGVGEQAVAAALRELRAAHLVLAGTDDATFDFRHALIRDAIYDDTDLPARRLLHARVAEAAPGLPAAVVSAHFELAGNPPRTFRFALAAAREAAAVSAHREALELYRRAVRNTPADWPDRVALLAALADEAAAVDENVEAAATYEKAHHLALEQDDPQAAAGIVPRLVAVGHLLGSPLRERVARLRDAERRLDEAGLAAPAERAALCSGTAAAYMLDRRLDEAIAEGECSRSGARAAKGDVGLNTAVTLGSVMVFAGRPGEGWPLLESSITRARDTHREAETARGYRMLASTASVVVEYDRADRFLRDGIAYAETVEMWNHRHYLAAHLAHVRWATGDWDAAEREARQALADGRGGITTRITAQYVLGYLAFGRGSWTSAQALLGEALSRGRDMAELQRFSPPLWGLAEMARCQGSLPSCVELCEQGYRASAEVNDAAYLFPFLLTGTRAHLALGQEGAAEDFAGRVGEVLLSRSVPGTLPAIAHARALLRLAAGDLSEQPMVDVVRTWSERRRFWESTWGLGDLAEIATRRRRRAEASRYREEIRVRAAATGATVFPAVASPRPGQPWHPLTAREFEVARLIADGLTNRQIAERLVVAPKTVSAHVEHILTKLGVGRRTEIAVWAAGVSAPASR